MTTYEWSMLSVAVIGGLCTLGTIVVSVTRAISKIEINTKSRIDSLRTDVDKRFISQDEIYREVAQGLRKFVELVEAEMHRIEIWGRDHYVLKDDHAAALAEIRRDIKDLAKEIKADFREARDEFRNAFESTK